MQSPVYRGRTFIYRCFSGTIHHDPPRSTTLSVGRRLPGLGYPTFPTRSTTHDPPVNRFTLCRRRLPSVVGSCPTRLLHRQQKENRIRCHADILPGGDDAKFYLYFATLNSRKQEESSLRPHTLATGQPLVTIRREERTELINHFQLEHSSTPTLHQPFTFHVTYLLSQALERLNTNNTNNEITSLSTPSTD